MAIKLLSEQAIARIAAGEVVERPASVVKELVENSLDAGATRIEIEVRGGGTELIRVSDNGGGIPADEVALAFKRHATSKIAAVDDLQSVATLGFRGEALPSLAAVADIDMITSPPGAGAAASYRIRGGVAHQASAARAAGTTVSVVRLFGRVPARLKFLKTRATEQGRIAAVVTAYALAYPEVAFSLSFDGRSSLRTSGGGKPVDAVAQIYGTETAAGMLVLAGGNGELPVSGMVSAPDLSRRNRERMHFFVNRRWVSVRSAFVAVEQAYHGLMPEGRYPVAVINIVCDPAAVDVNIHPAKTEVKFRDAGAVFSAVQRAVRAALVSEMPVPRLGDRVLSYSEPPRTKPGPLPVSPGAAFRGGLPLPPSPDTGMPETTPHAALPVLRVIGQLLLTYILAEGPDGLYIIDQHAAHERIMKEKISAARAAHQVEVQGLLEPVTLEVSPAEDAVLRDRYHDLAEFGFDIAPFGERGYLVRAVPALLRDKDWRQALREMLDRGAPGSEADWWEHVTNTMACHGAIRAGKALTTEEMRELVRQMEQAALPHTCPHGRPTMMVVPRGRLGRQFGRT